MESTWVCASRLWLEKHLEIGGVLGFVQLQELGFVQVQGEKKKESFVSLGQPTGLITYTPIMAMWSQTNSQGCCSSSCPCEYTCVHARSMQQCRSGRCKLRLFSQVQPSQLPGTFVTPKNITCALMSNQHGPKLNVWFSSVLEIDYALSHAAITKTLLNLTLFARLVSA